MPITQVTDLALFRKMRGELASELESTKEIIHKNERKHKAHLDDLERKFVAARQRLEQEANDKIAQSRKVFSPCYPSLRSGNDRMQKEISQQY